MGMIVDVFMYSGEEAMAELRQLALYGLVDYHVAVVGDRTHQGEPIESPAKCPQVGPCPVSTMIAHLPANENGDRGGVHSSNYQRQERMQRQAMGRATSIVGTPDSIFLASDVDEIPSPAGMAVIKAMLGGESELPWIVLGQRMHGFALDYLHPQLWWGTMAALPADFRPQEMRDARGDEAKVSHLGWYGSELGWHLSWMGSIEQKARKRDTFSHRELASLDVVRAYHQARHANGEELSVLSPERWRDMQWPETMIDGSFSIPPEWWSPTWTG